MEILNKSQPKTEIPRWDSDWASRGPRVQGSLGLSSGVRGRVMVLGSRRILRSRCRALRRIIKGHMLFISMNCIRGAPFIKILIRPVLRLPSIILSQLIRRKQHLVKLKSLELQLLPISDHQSMRSCPQAPLSNQRVK